MSRLQLALNVSNLEESIAFYSKLFGVQPAKVKPGYANFAIAEPPLKLVLMENKTSGGTINHLGVEVKTTAEVEQWQEKLAIQEMNPKSQKDNTCCYAKQDKFWVADPDNAPWEIYTVLKDTAEFGESTIPVLSSPKANKCCN